MENMSLYIPRVFANIMDKDIREVFERNYIGKIHHIDFVDKMGKDHKVYHSAYIHFEYWYDTIRGRNIQYKLSQGENLRIMYDGPWYWLIYKNKTKKFGGDGIRKERITLLPLLEKVVQNPVHVTVKDTIAEESVHGTVKDTIAEESVVPINFDHLCLDLSFDDLCVDFSREEINQIEINIFKEFELYIPAQ